MDDVDPTRDRHIAFKSDVILYDVLTAAAEDASEEAERYHSGLYGRAYNKGRAAGLLLARQYLTWSQQ